MVEAGDLLIAPPTMPDLRFRRSVMLLTHHSSEGSMALCLNRPTNIDLEQICQEIGVENLLNHTVYWGGPVSPSSIWLLHSSEWVSDNTHVIDDHWAVSSNEEMFRSISQGDFPKRFRFLHGFSTWAPEQLNCELKGDHPWDPKNSWLTVSKPDPDILFETAEDCLWEAATELSGQQAVSSWL